MRYNWQVDVQILPLTNAKNETAGADFGAQLAPHGPKADLVSPTTVGGVHKPGTCPGAKLGCGDWIYNGIH